MQEYVICDSRKNLNSYSAVIEGSIKENQFSDSPGRAAGGARASQGGTWSLSGAKQTHPILLR